MRQKKHIILDLIFLTSFQLGLTKSMSVSTFSLLLATCDAETHNNRSATKVISFFFFEKIMT